MLLKWLEFDVSKIKANIHAGENLIGYNEIHQAMLVYEAGDLVPETMFQPLNSRQPFKASALSYKLPGNGL